MGYEIVNQIEESGLILARFEGLLSFEAICPLLDDLIKLEAVYYTQGEVDFVDIVDAPSPDAMLAFSVWYVKQGFGRFRSLPAFDDAAMRAALAKA